ncbi:DNA mismatch repair protein Msh6-like isoform X2 [Varroa jacobsoni]|uniref:DNA mismatch repair protein n=1 Tax=Varroa destructor TaxID=109461 RepID=A0A7M7K5F2_VARDE|nr:DNA mismatch repair protein Msh6-like isoform X2 [Varroa destructor]XP_022687980.1 DNA mismatch repair protein Msh6-like isoform X2 [Varroa jacobsoni]
MSQNTLFAFFKKVDTPSKRKKVENENTPVEANSIPPKTPTVGTPQTRTSRAMAKSDSPNSTPKSSAKTSKSDTPFARKQNSFNKEDGKKRKPLKPANGEKPKKRARLEEHDTDDWAEELPSSEEEDVDSGDDYIPPGDGSEKGHDSSDSEPEGDVEMEPEPPTENDDDDEDIAESPVKKSRRAPRHSRSAILKTPTTQEESGSSQSTEVGIPPQWLHLTLNFVTEPRDSERRPRSHPDYDYTTLYVPPDYLNKATPGMRQWWVIKSRHFDTVLFFKVGKFYELYHMDAVIGVEQLGLTFMKGEWAHSGFPEIALQRNMEALVQKGYRCARVEQTETPTMMEERCKKSGKTSKYDKVVRREVCQISSKGLQLCGSMEASGTSYLLAVRQKGKRFGVCLVDTSVARLHVGEFEEDHQLSCLRTLVSQFTPVEALLERTCHNDVKLIVEAIGAKIIVDRNRMTPEQCLTMIREGNYFKEKEYPIGLKTLLSEDDPLMSTPRKGCELAVQSLAAILDSLKEALLLEDVLTMGDVEPIQFKYESGSSQYLPKVMILDSVALTNLEIFQNSCGSSEGSLLSTINFCSTPFGLRELKKWLLAPSCIADVIESRWDAVGDLMSNNSVAKKVQERLRKIPDMDKMLARIHSLSLKKGNHPDSRAIIYNSELFAKKKIEEFIEVLQGFQDSLLICDVFKEVNLKSSLLKSVVTKQENGGQFPDLQDALDFFERAFDQKKALKEGKITPVAGVDAEFDDATEQVNKIKDELDEHLKLQIKHFGTKVTYTGTGRTAYQLEVPETAASKADPSKHIFKGQRKGFRRYSTAESERFCAKLLEAQDAREAAGKDMMRRIFVAFDERRPLWKKAIECLCVLDCLLSLALYGLNAGGSVCRPKIVSAANDTKPMMRIKNGSHPCLLKVLGANKLIANDFALGIQEKGRCNGSSVALLTGPNMGGKSTLMRQVGLLAVLAQLGAWVPADEMEFSLVDRVFTRLGASDHITLGESTFLVELLETSAAFKHGSRHSLLLLDELGRGTATHDGASIAYAVLNRLVGHEMRTLFSTHYHELASDVRDVFLGHMAYVVEREDEVVFLYKFVEGNCEKSFGFNAARLAGVSPKLIEQSLEKAQEFENQSKLLQKFARYMTLDSER